MKRNAAIYARVSSDRQREQNTIASQTALLLEFATAHDCVVPQEWIFQDDGYSGSVLARPGLERLRDLVAEGFIETLLVYAPDRLSRKYAYQVLLLEEFSRCGAETVFLKSAGGDSPEDRLLVQFQGMIAEYERAQIAERTRRGKRHRAKTGCINVLSGAPYGYRYVRKSDAAEAYYAVIEAEAEVVREVFELYTKELWSIGAIGRHLNQRGVSTRFNKGPWERSTIRGMLRNPAYQGTACFGKTERAPRQKITKPLRQKGGFSTRSSTSRERNAQEWIPVPVPALVSEDIFCKGSWSVDNVAMGYIGLRPRPPSGGFNIIGAWVLIGIVICADRYVSVGRFARITSMNWCGSKLWDCSRRPSWCELKLTGAWRKV
jgi:site-specific DNA recombinase